MCNSKKGTGGRKYFCHPCVNMFRQSVVSKQVFYRRLLVWKNWIRGANKVPSNSKKSWIFFGAEWPATSTPSGCSMVPLGGQRTHIKVCQHHFTQQWPLWMHYNGQKGRLACKFVCIDLPGTWHDIWHTTWHVCIRTSCESYWIPLVNQYLFPLY